MASADPPRRTGSSIYQLAVEASIDSAGTWEPPRRPAQRRPASAAPISSKCRPASALRHSSTAAGELHHSVARRPSTAGSLQSYRRTPAVGARTVTTVPAQHSRLRETGLTDQARQHGRNLVESPARSDEKTHSRPKRATFRSIGLDAPDWWSPLPPTVAAAVDVFDRRHAMLSARATAAFEGAAQSDHPFERAARFEAALLAVQRHRYALPQKVRLLQKIEVRPKTAPARQTTTCMATCMPARYKLWHFRWNASVSVSGVRGGSTSPSGRRGSAPPNRAPFTIRPRCGGGCSSAIGRGRYKPTAAA